MIREFIQKGYCLKCKGCCRFAESDSPWSPNLLKEDIKALVDNAMPPFFILENKKIRLIKEAGEEGYLCPLLGCEDNRCKLYEARPFECRLYPFLLNRKGKEVFLSVDLKCPFAGDKNNSGLLKAHTKHLLGILNTPAFRKTLKKNPHMIQEYPGVTDLVVLNL